MINISAFELLSSYVVIVLTAFYVVFAYFRIRLQLAQAEMQHAQNDAKFWRTHYDDLSQRFKAFTEALNRAENDNNALSEINEAWRTPVSLFDAIQKDAPLNLEHSVFDQNEARQPPMPKYKKPPPPPPKKTSNDELKEEMVKQFRTPKRGSHQYENPADLDDF